MSERKTDEERWQAILEYHEIEPCDECGGVATLDAVSAWCRGDCGGDPAWIEIEVCCGDCGKTLQTFDPYGCDTGRDTILEALEP